MGCAFSSEGDAEAKAERRSSAPLPPAKQGAQGQPAPAISKAQQPQKAGQVRDAAGDAIKSEAVQIQVQANQKGPAQQPAGAPGSSRELAKLSSKERGNVQDTLGKVSALVQRFGEGRNDKTTATQRLRKALDLITQDAGADFGSVHVLTEGCEHALLLALCGTPEAFVEGNRLLQLKDSGRAVEVLVKKNMDYLCWSSSSGEQGPTDWHQLHQVAGLQMLNAVPIKVTSTYLGLLTLGFKQDPKEGQNHTLWPAYMQLIAASLSGMVMKNGIQSHLALIKQLQASPSLDAMLHLLSQSIRSMVGTHTGDHKWFKVALTADNGMAATVFEDLSQVPAPLMLRVPAASSNNSHSAHMLREVQAAGGILRTVVALKSTVMKIVLRSKQQVMIPDVQKLINQSGYVSSDIFNSRIIKPPTSVVVFPLKKDSQEVFGAIYCMSSVQSSFSDISPKLREICEIISPHIHHVLHNQIEEDYEDVLYAQAGEGGSSHSINTALLSSIQRSGSMKSSKSFQSSKDSFSLTQSMPSTGALVTGITEKLNQKRTLSSMDFVEHHDLEALQITRLLGEGGFAKVFSGSWRGLLVAIKVVCDDGQNEKNVIKNAHEIAILRAISHPNIVQAFTCMTDVPVSSLLATSFEQAPPELMYSPVVQYMQGMEDKMCHIEVIDYCDLGNMGTALNNHIFQVPRSDKMLATVAAAVRHGLGSDGWMTEPTGKIYMQRLLLTLVEIASAIAYLHRMGIVHCDIKPGNVLLRSSHLDPRGFTTKLSDFGLSRVEDDEQSTFPFNSCGTASYVAPEALICNRKVTSSVDTYAFGILLWAMYTGQQPYGNMSQQQIVEEVVMRGLRPKFPAGTPRGYAELAQACWAGSAASRPTFEEVLDVLQTMLQAIDDKMVLPLPPINPADLYNIVEYPNKENVKVDRKRSSKGAQKSSGQQSPHAGNQQQDARKANGNGSHCDGSSLHESNRGMQAFGLSKPEAVLPA